jgi:2-aminoadipate transaminase
VIYLSTFSKTLAPGLRLGWVIAPPEVIRKLVQAKQGADLHTATFNQMVAYEVSRGGFLDRHIQLILKVYGERRDVMLASMDRFFPPEVEWTHPQGGLFLWVTLPSYMDANDLLKACLKRKVAFVPGEHFHPSGGGKNTMRINFSNATPENIQEGINRLGTTIGEMVGKTVAM